MEWRCGPSAPVCPDGYKALHHGGAYRLVLGVSGLVCSASLVFVFIAGKRALASHR
jgi:hypothetical protein